MIEILKIIFIQLVVFVYQFTSLRIWGIDLSELSRRFRDYVINSTAIHVIQFVLVPATIVLFIGLANLLRKHRELNAKILAQLEAEMAVAVSEPATTMGMRWQEITQHIDSIREGEWKFAVIEANKIVDDVLKNSFAGETMGERLMNIDKTQLLTIDGLWEAHKVRNRLAHDTNYFLRHAEAVRTIRLYEETLKELGVL